MTSGQLLLGAAGIAVVALCLALLVGVRRLRAQVEQMQRSVDRLCVDAPPAAAPASAYAPPAAVPSPPAVPAETTPRQAPATAPPTEPSASSLVTAVLGGPLVKLAAFSYALRQALSVDNRRHLSRVVDQELRAARRRRRTAMVGARRTARVR